MRRAPLLRWAWLLALVASAAPSWAAAEPRTPSVEPEPFLQLEEFSPAALGIYRKMMEIEDVIRRATDRYGVDYDLARATCMYESGGNADLTSWAGAQGYFQVMPSTFRSLGVATNIEAGVKYISQLIKQFEREDYALAAYNGGPGNVGRGRAMRLESLQYVLGVGSYRTLLKLYEPSLRHHAAQLSLTTVGDEEDWWAVSRRLGLSLLQLRLHNPYLARRELLPGQLIAYPGQARDDLFVRRGQYLEYRTRLGDNYFNVAFTLDVELDLLRAENSLWHLQTLPAGMVLKIPLEWEGEHTVHRVAAGETIDAISKQLNSDVWRVIRDNGLFWSEELAVGSFLRVREVPRRPSYVVHRVSNGENLTMLARRYGTTIALIQRANSMGSRTAIRIGEQLRIPAVIE